MKKALAAEVVNTTHMDGLFRDAQSALASAADRGYLPKNKARRTISKLAEKVRAVIAGEPTRLNEQKRTKLAPHHPELESMEWWMQLNDFLEETAPPVAAVDDFLAWQTELREKHPNRWVVYTDRWDEVAGRSRFEVAAVFDSEQAATDWTLTLSDEERSLHTVEYINPEPDPDGFTSPLATDIEEVA